MIVIHISAKEPFCEKINFFVHTDKKGYLGCVLLSPTKTILTCYHQQICETGIISISFKVPFKAFDRDSKKLVPYMNFDGYKDTNIAGYIHELKVYVSDIRKSEYVFQYSQLVRRIPKHL